MPFLGSKKLEPWMTERRTMLPSVLSMLVFRSAKPSINAAILHAQTCTDICSESSATAHQGQRMRYCLCKHPLHFLKPCFAWFCLWVVFFLYLMCELGAQLQHPVPPLLHSDAHTPPTLHRAGAQRAVLRQLNHQLDKDFVHGKGGDHLSRCKS